MSNIPSDDDDHSHLPSFSIAYSLVPAPRQQRLSLASEELAQSAEDAHPAVPLEQGPIEPEPTLYRDARTAQIPEEVVAAWLLDVRSVDKMRAIIQLFQDGEMVFSDIMSMDADRYAERVQRGGVIVDEAGATLDSAQQLELENNVAKYHQIAQNHLHLDIKNPSYSAENDDDRRNALLDEAEAIFYDDAIIVEERIKTSIHRNVWREVLAEIGQNLLDELDQEEQEQLDASLEGEDEYHHESIKKQVHRDFQNRVYWEAVNQIEPNEQEFYDRRVDNETERAKRRYFWERQAEADQNRKFLRNNIRYELQLELEIAELTKAAQGIREGLEIRYPEWAEQKLTDETNKQLESNQILSTVFKQVDRQLKELEVQIEEEMQERTAHWEHGENESIRSNLANSDKESRRDALIQPTDSPNLQTRRTKRQVQSEWNSTISRVHRTAEKFNGMVASIKNPSTSNQYKTINTKEDRRRTDVRDIFVERPIFREASGSNSASQRKSVRFNKTILDVGKVASLNRQKPTRMTLKQIDWERNRREVLASLSVDLPSRNSDELQRDEEIGNSKQIPFFRRSLFSFTRPSGPRVKQLPPLMPLPLSSGPPLIQRSEDKRAKGDRSVPVVNTSQPVQKEYKYYSRSDRRPATLLDVIKKTATIGGYLSRAFRKRDTIAEQAGVDSTNMRVKDATHAPSAFDAQLLYVGTRNAYFQPLWKPADGKQRKRLEYRVPLQDIVAGNGIDLSNASISTFLKSEGKGALFRLYPRPVREDVSRKKDHPLPANKVVIEPLAITKEKFAEIERDARELEEKRLALQQETRETKRQFDYGNADTFPLFRLKQQKIRIMWNLPLPVPVRKSLPPHEPLPHLSPSLGPGSDDDPPLLGDVLKRAQRAREKGKSTKPQTDDQLLDQAADIEHEILQQKRHDPSAQFDGIQKSGVRVFSPTFQRSGTVRWRDQQPEMTITGAEIKRLQSPANFPIIGQSPSSPFSNSAAIYSPVVFNPSTSIDRPSSKHDSFMEPINPFEENDGKLRGEDGQSIIGTIEDENLSDDDHQGLLKTAIPLSIIHLSEEEQSNAMESIADKTKTFADVWEGNWDESNPETRLIGARRVLQDKEIEQGIIFKYKDLSGAEKLTRLTADQVVTYTNYEKATQTIRTMKMDVWPKSAKKIADSLPSSLDKSTGTYRRK